MRDEPGLRWSCGCRDQGRGPDQVVRVPGDLEGRDADPAGRRDLGHAGPFRDRQVRVPETLVGLLKPEQGSIWINDRDLTRLREHDLYAVRKLFGVLFQDGALFGSMSLYDNIAFPLREHTKKTEAAIRTIVGEKIELVGLQGAEAKLPGEISGGMRKRAAWPGPGARPGDHPVRRAGLRPRPGADQAT